MDKYPEFVITRNEMRQCKRSNDVHADKNGCRSYSIMPCPHGCLVELVVASNSITHSKANAVRDHLVICPNFTGERPAKRGKPSEKSTALVPFTCNHPHHDKQSQEWEDMKHRMSEMESKLGHTEDKLDVTLKVVAQHHIWWQRGAELVGLQPPQDPPVILDALKLLRDQSASTTLGMTSDSTRLLEQHETFKLMLSQKDDTISQKDVMMSEYKANLEQKTTENSELKLELDNERIHVEKMRKEVEAASRASVEASKREAEKMEALAASKKREEVLNSKYKESLRSLEKVTKNHKQIGKSLLSHAQQAQKSYVLQNNKLSKSGE